MKLSGDPHLPTPSPGRSIDRVTWLCLAMCVGIFLALRCRWLGHLLVWDEAMALCTTRAFHAGADDPFAAWFWRHPPLHSLLLLGLRPLQEGFAERAEFLSIIVGVVNQVLLFFLNRRVFGNAVGLWSAFLIALLPGSAFFGVWIKQDHLVMTFGLLALISLLSQRTWISGVCLGLALLTKGTAAFYCLAAFALWLGGAGGRRTAKDFFLLTGFSALTCGWWYLGVLPRVHVPGGGDVFQFALNSQALWQSEWSFYFTQLPVLLGWAGVGLTVLGCVLAVRAWLLSNGSSNGVAEIWMTWPVCVLGPALALISFVPNKVPWIVIALLPAWATLAALAAAKITEHFAELRPVSVRWFRPAVVAGAAAVLAVMTLAFSPRDYDSMLRRVASSQWRGAANSREAAAVLNENVQDGERLLLTSFHYWQGLPPGLPDPIFTYYLEKKPSVLLRSHQQTFGDVVADIRKYQLDWALLSPEPGDAANAIFGGFEQSLGLQAKRTSGAWLFRTTALYPRVTAPDTASVGR